MNILAICGSLRARSLNAAVLRAAREVAPGHWSVAMEAGLSGLPYFDAELEKEALPQVVAEFRGRVGAADGLLIDELTRAELRKVLASLDEAVRDANAQA